ncbi:uncharacterized protein LOC128879291 isoform X1 [Hylaeus volcanicus]|uniref:uncharacterized protein LOC128879291 isoform X1 n=1 Tax=Hylaeus volcanicus TaxID=313075 RepID=UPI0023B87E1E|nr:uncharacterized protein LOC128879291 isoform X1 [Hylaeus volcanicus]XP_053984267.1 uncharacterized protein LOC128879291 isoform X1 [Hylaeus volcanicus]
MSDLAKNLLTQYYGLNSESPSKRFLSIHKSIEDAKNEEEKQVTDQISLTTNEENVSENESQNDEDGRKLSVASESYRRSSRIFDDINDAYDSNENSDTIEIDLGQNILCDVCENEPSTIHEELSILTATEIKGNYLKDATRSDSSLTFVEDTFTENASEVSGLTLKKSQRSSRIGTPLPVSKKEPICNETFADFSNTEIKQFPNEILNRFSRLRMLYMADNNLTELPSEVFTSLRYLEWLDLRNNQLSSLPNSIESHQCIETLLLQGNKFEELPLELCTLAKLKTLQVARNPLVTPPKEIVALGCKEILEFLRTKWNDAHPERRVEFKESKIEPKLSTILCYQSPKRSRKRISSSKNTVRDRNASTRDKRKSYKPSNRYYDEKLAFLMNIDQPFKKKSTVLCDSCSKEKTCPETSRKQNNAREKMKFTCSGTVNCRSNIHDKIDKTDSKILRLTDPSPRSLYVRRNVRILRTYTKSLKKECRVKLPSDKFQHFVPLKGENKLVDNDREYESINNVEQIFDIITNDGKRFKLHPMRLTNSDWILLCLENYLGTTK